jgi:hypothetical protein
MKKTATALIFLILFSSVIFCVQVRLASASTSVTGIFTSDATWTPSGSPYILNGPTAVNKGVTLTIEPGVTVDINNFYLQVNGTLTAKGSGSSQIQFTNGMLRFTPASNGWNNQAATGWHRA